MNLQHNEGWKPGGDKVVKPLSERMEADWPEGLGLNFRRNVIPPRDFDGAARPIGAIIQHAIATDANNVSCACMVDSVERSTVGDRRGSDGFFQETVARERITEALGLCHLHYVSVLPRMISEFHAVTFCTEACQSMRASVRREITRRPPRWTGQHRDSGKHP